MDNSQGDLTDVVRGGSSGGGGGVAGSGSSSWQPISFPCGASDPIPITNMERGTAIRDGFFGDPFCNMRDPLLHELNATCFTPPPSSNYHHHHMLTPTTFDGHDDVDVDVDDATPAATPFRGGVGADAGAGATSSSYILAHQAVFEEEMHNNPSPMFSRIQISPNLQPPNLPDSPVMSAPSSSSSASGFKTTSILSGDLINSTVTNSKACLIENNAGPVQIPSPRNLGIKRRKSQAKKVVCIPAPAAANSRPSGEVVPSDLWAWRKYGQKPIKGSPYPRGYYRCSSSKGCSARKQVERSRTDPNMLVITYTSEHNHPWPTQRNALAGSTRSQHPQKSNAAAAASSSKTSQQAGKIPNSNSNSNSDSNDKNTRKEHSNVHGAVKEEIGIEMDGDRDEDQEDDQEEQVLENNSTSTEHDGTFHAVSYRPAMPSDDIIQSPSTGAQTDDLFADLGEIETDPLRLLFAPTGDDQDVGQRQESKAFSDPFTSFFDWTNNNNSSTSFGEAKRGL